MLAQERIERIAETTSAGRIFQFDIIEVERGWLRSRAVLSMGIHDDYMAVLEQVFSKDTNRTALAVELPDVAGRFNLDISHGPLLPQGGFGVAEVVARMYPNTEGLDDLLDATMEMQGPLEAALRIGIGNETPYRWTFPPMAFSSPAAAVSASRLGGEGIYDSARQRLTGQMRMDDMEFSTDAVGLNVENLTFSMDVAESGGGIWPGSSVMSLDRLAIELPLNESTIVVERIEAHGRSEVGADGELFHNSSEMSADSLSNATSGNAHVMTDIRFDSAFRNLDVASLNAYRDWAFDLAGETDPLALFVGLHPIIYTALAAEPEFDVGPLGLNWNDGALQASIELRIDNEMLPAEPVFSLLDTALWSRLVAVEAEVDIDRNIAEWIAMHAMARQGGRPAEAFAEIPEDIMQAQSRGTLIALVAQGMLEETGSGYRFRGSYNNGVVEVNGRVVPLGAAAPSIF